MAEEMVIWVDAQGKPLGPIPISLANSDPNYLHLEVAVLIVDDQKRVLLQKRSLTKKVAPGIWTVSAAGHVTYGESSEQVVHKELKEEMGISVKTIRPIFTNIESLPNETHMIKWYIATYEGGDIVVQASEVESYAWVPEAEITAFTASNNVSQGTLSVIKRYWSGEWDKLLS